MLLMTAEVWIHQSLAKRGRRRRFAPLSTTGSATFVAIVARRHIRGGCAGRSPPKNLFSGVCRQGPKAMVMELTRELVVEYVLVVWPFW